MPAARWWDEAPRRLSRVLVANRGEIACRIIRGCREVGLATVAIFHEADRDALHVELADHAVHLPGESLTETYLDMEAVLAAAASTGCDAIHPGYGFLSERAAFAEAVIAAGHTWVGPPPAAIRDMGDKVTSRRLMREAGVPIIPGEEHDLPADSSLELVVEALTASAERVGHPLLLKASAGGGGKGMRIVRDPTELAGAVEAAAREAIAAFGDGTLYVERLMEQARHVEVQVLADEHGHCIHLAERECSIQRRHQKVIEEAPSPVVDAALRARLGAAAVSAASAVNYVGAGTVEFLLLEDGSFHFLEMNTRLQVEHPVTEAVTGVDLVWAQLRVAAGLPLRLTQQDVAVTGHAIEARIYAEDPAGGFLPAIGPLAVWRPPEGPGLRLDTGVREGDEVTPRFDPMLAKLVAHAPTRDGAISRLRQALDEFVVLGTRTNIAFLADLVRHPAYQAAATPTSFIEDHWPDEWSAPASSDDSLVAAAAAEAWGLHRASASASNGDADDARGDATSPFATLRRTFP